MQLFTPAQYLKIDIAGRYGLDKSTWQERLDWFAAHESDLHSMIKTADEPAMYFAAVTAWEDCVAGRPSGYGVSLDATCSALQLLSVLTGDRLGAELCNVVGNGRRMDAYTEIYQRMLAATGGNETISRDKAKDAILFSLYGSTAEPKKVFGEGTLLNVFYNTMKEAAPAAWELNETYLSIWNPEAYEYNITLPDNFHMHLKVMSDVKDTVTFLGESFDVFKKVNAPVEGGRMLGANCNHAIDGMIVREMTARCGHDPKRMLEVKLALHLCNDEDLDHEDNNVMMTKTLWEHYEETGFLSVRILDYIDEYSAQLVDHDVIRELIKSLPPKPFQLMTVFDCFRCLPAYANDMRKQYNLQLHLIGKSTLLSSILSQILGRRVEIGKLDDMMYLDVLNANYALS